jgi:hypothetical protein
MKWRWKVLLSVPLERSEEAYRAIFTQKGDGKTCRAYLRSEAMSPTELSLHGMEVERTCYALERGTERTTDMKREDLHS